MPISRTNATRLVDIGFTQLYPHEVTIIPTTSYNSMGEPQAGTTRVCLAHVDPPSKGVQRGNTESQDRSTTVIVDDIEVLAEDKIILPDGTTRIITSVHRLDYVAGLDHSVIQCQ